jgi:hypothetical protein
MQAQRKAVVIPEDEWEWVERYLDAWALWMRHPNLGLGTGSRTPAFVGDNSGGYRDQTEEGEVAGHTRAVQVIEATLDGLSQAEVAAVMHVKLYAVYRFRFPVELIYLAARQKIGVRLRAHDFF